MDGTQKTTGFSTFTSPRTWWRRNYRAFWLGHFSLEKEFEGRKVEIRHAAMEYPHTPRVGEDGDDGAPLTQEARLTWHYRKLLEKFSCAHRNQYFELF